MFSVHRTRAVPTASFCPQPPSHWQTPDLSTNEAPDPSSSTPAPPPHPTLPITKGTSHQAHYSWADCGLGPRGCWRGGRGEDGAPFRFSEINARAVPRGEGRSPGDTRPPCLHEPVGASGPDPEITDADRPTDRHTLTTHKGRLRAQRRQGPGSLRPWRGGGRAPLRTSSPPLPLCPRLPGPSNPWAQRHCSIRNCTS